MDMEDNKDVEDQTIVTSNTSTECPTSGDDDCTDHDRNESVSANSEEIKRLRELMALRPETDFDDYDDASLVTFLQARRYNVDNAFELLCNFFEFRKKTPNLFESLEVSELRYVLEDGFPCVLPYLDASGAKFMVLFPGTWDLETFDVETILKAVILSLERLSSKREVRLKGIILLVDFSGWTTNHAMKLNIGYIRKIIAIFQESSPVWYRNIHLINQPWYVNALISVMKPFMKDDIQGQIFLHGNNMTTLHSHIPPENLPAEFGGDKPEVDQCYWANILLENEKREQRKVSTIRRGKNPLRRSIIPGFFEPTEAEPLLNLSSANDH